MIAAVGELKPVLGVSRACVALSVTRSRWYRAQRPRRTATPARPTPAHALSAAERAQVLEVLNSERFQDQAPREVYATLLDEERYVCSVRQMYRILGQNEQVQERRNQLRHPAYAKPQLVATRPNTAWSWDITKLLGPTTWTYYYLYVVLDIFSRYVVGWMLAREESAELACQLIESSCRKQSITTGQLTLHADRGSAMVSKSLAQLLSDLGVARSHSRPYTADDNPYSEAQFKTMKYRPGYPLRFAGEDHALTWARGFFPWYNDEHHHTSLALLTPADVHYGRAAQIIAQRQRVLQAAYARHPRRFAKGAPVHPAPPTAAWINPPPASTPAPPQAAMPAPDADN